MQRLFLYDVITHLHQPRGAVKSTKVNHVPTRVHQRLILVVYKQREARANVWNERRLLLGDGTAQNTHVAFKQNTESK